MKRPISLFLLTLCSIFMLSLSSCDGCTDEATTGEKIEEAVEDTGDALEEGADEAGDAVEEAADEAGDAVEDAAEEAEDAVDDN